MSYRGDVVKEARSWIGTPYKHYTSRKGLGVDCGLFVMQVYANLGLITYKMPEVYPEDWAYHRPTGEMFEDIVKSYCDPIPKEKAHFGDIILYWFGKCMSHSAIVVNNTFIIHADKPAGVVETNRELSKWFKREYKYYTYRKK